MSAGSASCECAEISAGDACWITDGLDAMGDGEAGEIVAGVESEGSGGSGDCTGILPVNVLDGTTILPVSVIAGNLFVTSGLAGIGPVTRGSLPDIPGSESFPVIIGIGVTGTGRVFEAAGRLLAAGKIGATGGRGVFSTGPGCATPRIDSGSGPVVYVGCSIRAVVAGPSAIEELFWIEHASAMAAASNEAIGKRVAVSFAIARRITSDSAGGILGLIKIGGVGSVLMCCIITATELSSRKGSTPVQIS